MPVANEAAGTPGHLLTKKPSLISKLSDKMRSRQNSSHPETVDRRRESTSGKPPMTTQTRPLDARYFSLHQRYEETTQDS